jgi:hypothetical protein
MVIPNKITLRLLLGACLFNLAIVADGWAQDGDPQQAQSSSGSSPQADQQRPADNPLESRWVLDDMTWQNGSLIPYGVPPAWFDFKDKVYDKIGLKFGVDYQMLFQAASEVTPTASFDTALGDWWGFLTRWTLVDREQDYEGTLVFSMYERGIVGNNASPSTFGAVELGAIWTNVEFTNWTFAIENLYWEQWLGKNRFKVRVGNQIATTIINPFRFKDARSSFTASPLAFHESIPNPTFGFGVAAKWWPVEDSELYVAGTLNDMNGDPNLQGFNWNTVGRGEFFYGVEIGHYWRRGEDDFDHVHLDVFYADERSTRFPEELPNEAGGGFKFLGSKQIGKWVGFGSYTFNTAEGGGVGGSFAKHTTTAGIAYLNPLALPGEAAFAFMLMDPNQDIFADFDFDARTQYGTEAYWKVLLTPHIWVHAGIQLLVDPTLNPEVDFSVIPQFKFRVAI